MTILSLLPRLSEKSQSQESEYSLSLSNSEKSLLEHIQERIYLTLDLSVYRLLFNIL